jgi:serine/threonine protein kinase
MALAAGVRLGRYEIVTLLRTGGMGEVYRATDSRLHRDVATVGSSSPFRKRYLRMRGRRSSC